jgi:hypothetical protein
LGSQALSGIAFLLLGYLAFNNSQMPRGLAILAYAVGVFSALAAIVGALTTLTTVYQALLGLQLIVWIVWSVWLWRIWLTPKLVTA